MKRVVVTGLGVVAPCGIGKNEFWSNLLKGKSFVREDREMKELGIKSTVLARHDGFAPAEWFTSPEDIWLLEEDRFVQFGVLAGRQAMLDAGLMPLSEPERAGVISATAIGGTPTVSSTWERLTKRGTEELRYERCGSPLHHATASNFPGSVLMREFGMGGPCAALSTGCTAGLDALGLSFEHIQNGDASVMLAGASEAPLAKISYATLDAIGALSTAEGEPSTRSRPFDATRAGFVLGEGAAFLVLEELEHARARGANIACEILSFASVSNAFHMSDLPAEGQPMTKVIRRALAEAEIDLARIGYINAHGSSTPQNDIFETNAYKEIFGPRAYQIPVSSTKSMIGHSLSSASLMGVIAAIGAMKLSMIHPTVHLRSPDPRCDLDYVVDGPRNAKVDASLITASGFGGIHSATVLSTLEWSNVA
jgi:3-oxoacyl-(acyl-carrier-protein) synthase